MKISLLQGSALIHPVIFRYLKALSRGNESSVILYHEHGMDNSSTCCCLYYEKANVARKANACLGVKKYILTRLA
jgi:hypothetical protein